MCWGHHSNSLADSNMRPGLRIRAAGHRRLWKCSTQIRLAGRKHAELTAPGEVSAAGNGGGGGDGDPGGDPGDRE